MICFFNSSSTVNNLTIIYEWAWFPNVFQISNLNKDITLMATLRAIFVCHAMDHVGANTKVLTLTRCDAILRGCSPARPSIPPIFFLFFFKKQGLEEKSRVAIVL